jgi:hypothetical protein
MARPTTKTSADCINLTTEQAEGKHAWPGQQAAVASLGVTKARFREMLQTGQVQAYKFPDGSRRYDPDQIREMADAVFLEDDDESPAGDAQATRVGGIAIASAAAGIDILKQTQGHLERVLNTTISALEKSNGALVLALDYSLKRQEILERTHAEEIRLRDQVHIEELAANVEAQVTLSAEERRTALTSAVLPHVGPVLAQLTAGLQDATDRLRSTFAGTRKDEPAPQSTAPTDTVHETNESTKEETVAKAALALMRSVGPEKLKMLEMAGLLDETQLTLLGSLVEEIKETPTS